MDNITLSSMLNAISSGNCLSMVRVAGHHDRAGIQQALDLGANGILIPYVNNAEEAKQGISCCLYPTTGTRSVYFPQRCTNKDGLLGYVGNSNKNVVIAVQIETADSIKNIDEIVALPGLDIAFLGQNDLCLSMGLFEKYVFPEMYYSEELNAATQKIVDACTKYNKTPGVFLFGVDRVSEFLKKGFPFISVGNDLHHVLTQTSAYVQKLEDMTKEGDKNWKRQATSLF
jgi:4-hydroxy-2-oxoheptanedioate aldolase